MTTTSDVDRIRAEQTATWDAVSAGWLAWTGEFERAAGAVSAELLRLGGVRPGRSVLDFGTGLGEPALSAADAVGPTGAVVGVDLSPRMVALARQRAAGRPGVRFLVGGTEVVPGGHDVVLSRWALPFAGDRAAVLAALRSALRPGGVLAAAVWGPPAEVPMIALGFGALSRLLALDPPPPGPGPFAMADPAGLRAEVAAAGFREVAVTELVVDFRLTGPDAFAGFTLDVLPPRLRGLLRERFGDERHPSVRHALAEAVDPFRADDGEVRLPSRCLLVRGVA
ncbi:class I SAM-dependent methyltransferase [Goodfellowiella coeruleoviolacea]|uniref:Methyltransferase domain-containing protein n=1 Tax=Goodfellowiella coeruleoviolacea TaxID=334858 RepID=A0AAE3GI34_9PSEU|nr:methyltransferase domain-containing protein [Goodfellowiella coeruleoviolacea]MCP2167729.1 Methyltransferase domain-containing protein [Goodfellowiella coeruleoviolacea]